MTTKAYDVASGVPFVNGAAVPKDRVVLLTNAEAAFDLALARISPQAPADEEPAEVGRTKPRRRAPPADAGG